MLESAQILYCQRQFLENYLKRTFNPKMENTNVFGYHNNKTSIISNFALILFLLWRLQGYKGKISYNIKIYI